MASTYTSELYQRHAPDGHNDASNYTVAKLILNKEPSGIGLRDEEGRTALDRAIEETFEASVALLPEQPSIDANDEWGDTALILAVQEGQTDLVRLMLDKPEAAVDVNVDDDNGHTALHFVLAGNRDAISDMLLAEDELGAGHLGLAGREALYWALIAGNLDVLERLLERDDVNVNFPDRQGKMAYKLARGGRVQTSALEAWCAARCFQAERA
ncbi:ankyrin repeat-containing domain protein [Aspergillus recurvatus]